MPRRRQTRVGKLNPVDVRSKKDVGAFESLLGRGPLTIVLVYADWCGHCQTFKQNMWNEASSMPKKNLNTASVHYDMLDKTSLKNAKIDGYPSLLLVGTNKQPASFKGESGETNAMPAPESVEELKNMVNTPVNNTVSNANTVASNVVNNAKTPVNTVTVNSVTTSTNNNANSMMTNTVVSNKTNNIVSNAKSVNTYEPANAELLNVPDTTADMATDTILPRTEVRSKVGGGQRGGSESLLAALTRITVDAGHAGALLLAATEYADMGKRFTRRLKKRSKRTAKRKQRR
jgi:hypothetical protein